MHSWTRLLGIILLLGHHGIWGNGSKDSVKSTQSSPKFSVLTTHLVFWNWGDEKINTHHYELHFRYRITDQDVIGLKATTWQLFAPMGYQFWENELMNEDFFYPGRLEEQGIGITYQRFLWKNLYASIEVLPLKKRYLNTDKHEIDHGFKLYTTYHLGYHFDFFKKRFFVEPQIHCNYWPIDTQAPESFAQEDRRAKANYFLFEPNLYIGFSF